MLFKKLPIMVLICFMVINCLISLPIKAVELDLEAESAILVDAHSGRVLYEKDPQKTLYPASMTKLMTLVLAMEAVSEGRVTLEDQVIASENASSYGGSQIYLAAGEKLSLYELLLGIALASGNDASVAVAEHIAGSHEAFVEMMNEKAVQLGMKNTHFVNCNGLHDDNHYTTAYDFALLALEALRYPELLKMCTIKHYRIRENTKPFQFDNKNKLLWWYPGADGFKTGWTVDAKYCFTGTVQRNGLRFVSVVMGIKQKSGQFRDTMKLYNWGFAQYVFKEFYKEDEVLAQVQVGKGNVAEVQALPEKKVGITVPKGTEKSLKTEIKVVPLANAPIKKGQVLGHVSIVQEGNILSITNIIAGEDVAKGSLLKELIKVFESTLAG